MTAAFESMKQLSYLSMAALASIATALLYVTVTDVMNIGNHTSEGVPQITLETLNLAGMPYFFGISLFMFEGNALALEIYQ